MKKKNKIGKSFRTRFDTITYKGYLLIDFFDSDDDYLGTIKIWDNGEVWLESNESTEEIRFKSPVEFFKSLNKKGE